LLTQKLWRLRVKFLFSSTSFTSVRIQTLSLSFDKLTRRGGGGAKMGGGGGVGMPQTAVANPGALGRSSSHSHHPMLYRGGSMSTTTSTTASMTTTPTGSSTPCSDSVYGEDVSEISEEASTGSLHSRAGSTSSISGGQNQSQNRHSSGGGGGGGSSRRRADREAIGNLLMVIDTVIGQGGTDRLLIEELQQLKTRLQDHLSQRSSDQDLNSTIARITSIVQSIMR
jgi:hypothetical protein